MTRARTALVLAVLLLLSGLVAGSGPAAAASASAADPLLVTITSVTPGQVPRKGPVVVSGTVLNTTKQTWREINVYPQISSSPMTTRAEVAAAAHSNPDTTQIGDRLLDEGGSLGNLQPGASTTFTVRLRNMDLSAPGVYWIGVQALGTDDQGRDSTADGRARTFIPLVRGAVHASVSLVVPLRRTVRRAADGTLLRAHTLAAAVSSGGRLDNLLTFAHTADVPLTWLVDPAVLDAVHSLAHGNPGIAVRPDVQGGASPSTSPTEGSTSRADTPSDSDAAAAKAWLADLSTTLNSSTVLGLPYGDPDVSALTASHLPLLHGAERLAKRDFARQSVVVRHAAAPADGYLRPASLDALPYDTTVVLSDHGHPGPHPVLTNGEHRFVYLDSATAQGGPGPGPRTTPLQERQRILADAAINAIDGVRAPMVVELPGRWDPSQAASSVFFAGLTAASWLHVVDLPAGVATRSAPLPWPRSAARALVPAANTHAAGVLNQTARSFYAMLTGDPAPARTMTGVALAAVSYHARSAAGRARLRAVELERTARSLLGHIEVDGSDFVTLSGSSGFLTVSVYNGLDHRVTLGLRTTTRTSAVEIASPGTLHLAAGERSTVRLHAHTASVGVHQVEVRAVTTAGTQVGTPLQFSLRSSQIGTVFWGVLLACMLVLVVLVLRRVRQRVRSHRWRQ